MTERWLGNNNSRRNAGIGNPLMGPNPRARVGNYKKNKSTYRGYSNKKMKKATRMGLPIQLFKDSDRDGVANVFDCQPYNRKKQDVMHPRNFGSGLSDMYARRENDRASRSYTQMLKRMQKTEEERIKELQRLGTPTITYTTPSNSSPTPYVWNVSGTKLVSVNTAEGKAGLLKLQKMMTGGGATASDLSIGTTTPVRTTQPVKATTTTTKSGNTTTSITTYSDGRLPMTTSSTSIAPTVISGGSSGGRSSNPFAPTDNVLTRAIAANSSSSSGGSSSSSTINSSGGVGTTSYGPTRSTSSYSAPAPAPSRVSRAVSAVRSFFSRWRR